MDQKYTSLSPASSGTVLGHDTARESLEEVRYSTVLNH